MHHTQTQKDLFKEFSTDEKGLSSDQVKKRLEEYGLNELKKTKSFRAIKAFLAQFQSSLVIILIIAAIVSYFISQFNEHESPVDSIVIGIIVIVNAILGFLQEFKAEKSLEHLRNMLVPISRVMRDGKIQEVSSKHIVPGDVLLIGEGDTVSADARLIEASRLQVNEAALTGESLPRQKNVDVLPVSTPLAERNNMLYQGTDVVGGTGRAVVVDIGMQTQLGQISTLVQEIVEDKNPFQQKLDAFARKVGIVILMLCAIVVGGLIWGGDHFIHAFMVAVSLAVSAIPEGLPAVISLGFALATKRLVKKNVIVRKLPSSETLGRVTTICTDKTGTLTKSHMEVVDVHAFDEKAHKRLLLATSLCHSIEFTTDDEGRDKLLGDPTEIALVQYAMSQKHDPIDLEKKYSRKDEIPFTSERKMMTTIHYDGDNLVAYTKGAPERILDRVTHEFVGGKNKKLTKERLGEIQKEFENMASQGLRVLGYAYKTIDADKKYKDDEIENSLSFLGFEAMQDPAREEVPGAISACQKAGIRVIMLTGDSLLTAAAIGKKIGLTGEAMEARNMSAMSDTDLLKVLKTTSVFSRVEPADKLRIVDVLKTQDEIVAMTGDGVNDALALKRADIGIAMGIRGTDVSKGASDMILMDDNFASIVEGVAEGRRMFSNIKKFVTYLLAANFYEVVLVFSVIVIFRDPHLLPFLALQILWINLATDALPALALSTQPAEDNVMDHKPVSQDLLSGTKGFLIFAGMVGFTLLAYTLWKYHEDMEIARTMVVTVSVFYQMLLAINCASWGPIWRFAGNATLWVSVTISMGLHVALLYSPVGKFFSFVPLGISDWVFVVTAGVIGSIAVETFMYFVAIDKLPEESKIKNEALQAS